MKPNELRAFFEDTYTFLHQYDEERFEQEHIIALFMGIKRRVDWLEEVFAPDGAKLSADMSGRFFFVYQNGSILFKYALLCVLEAHREGGVLNTRGFLNIPFAQEKARYVAEFKNIADKIAELGIDIEALLR